MGDKFIKELERRAAKLKKGRLKVGFFENATYPDGTPVAYIAWIQEHGATINVAEHQQTLYRQVNKKGDFNKQGRFVKRKDSNFATNHTVGSHTITIPARPFFMRMIEDQKDKISAIFAKILISNNYDIQRSLAILGEYLKDELKDSIRNGDYLPNSESTIRKSKNPEKKKPLMETEHMINSVGYEVSND